MRGRLIRNAEVEGDVDFCGGTKVVGEILREGDENRSGEMVGSRDGKVSELSERPWLVADLDGSGS